MTGFPTLKFFPKGSAQKTPEDYSGGRATADFVEFLNSKSGAQRTESGSLSESAGRNAELDKIASTFIASADKKELIKQAKEIVEASVDKKKLKWYVKVMEAISEKGDGFLATEKARLTGVIEGKAIHENKIDEFTVRRNILNAF